MAARCGLLTGECGPGTSEPGYRRVFFRRLVSSIPSTTYATHGLYMYPAKFIPHVVRFALEKYSVEGDWVFDPFAGYGTVAIEASLTGRNFIVWDLNPMLSLLVKASLYRDRVSLEDLYVDFDYATIYMPEWSNLDYWHPREFLEPLSKAWGYYHHAVSGKLKPLIAIPLLKVTRRFSYSDERIAKLYRSRRAREKVAELLQRNYRDLMRRMYLSEARRLVSKIRDFQSRSPRIVEGVVEAGVDSLSKRLGRRVKLLVTSPPYLQAQEYIRSFKLELFWLGYSEEEIRSLARREIPYREPPEVRVESRSYWEYRRRIEKLGNHKLLRIYDSYFKSLVLFLNNNHRMIDRMAIFVGPVKIRGTRIPIDRILREHLESLGWRHVETLVDTIVSRRLFKTKVNPATGLMDERTPTEHLIILERAG